MALKRVTMQEIADACGLSRNTVSKVFNRRGSVPKATRDLVIAKARELGYYQYSVEATPAEKRGGNIALLTQHKLLTHNFGLHFITSFTNRISQSEFTMQMYEITPEELAGLRLPSLLDPEKVDGMLGIELFDRAYIDMVSSLGKPTAFVDAYVRASKTLIPCDFISMENVTSETAIVNRMIQGGAKRIGFVGDIEHCNSFYERWLGFRAALSEAGLTVDPTLCVLKEDSDLYADVDWVLEQLVALPELPDAFACANDFLAIQTMTALKRMGLAIPDDIMVTGFGGLPESAVIDPPLTTALIPSADIGIIAATILIDRIQHPGLAPHFTYVRTTPVWGGSTR